MSRPPEAGSRPAGIAFDRRPASPLRDEAILLREWHEDDVAVIVRELQDPEIVRWTRVPSPYTEADALDFLTRHRDRETGFAIVPAGGGEPMGAIGIRDMGESTGRLGYWVAASARGRGVAVRAGRLVAAWAFDDLGLARVELVTDPANVASQRVAERAGFTREGRLRSSVEIKGRRRDAVMFSLLPGELR